MTVRVTQNSINVVPTEGVVGTRFTVYGEYTVEWYGEFVPRPVTIMIELYIDDMLIKYILNSVFVAGDGSKVLGYVINFKIYEVGQHIIYTDAKVVS